MRHLFLLLGFAVVLGACLATPGLTAPPPAKVFMAGGALAVVLSIFVAGKSDVHVPRSWAAAVVLLLWAAFCTSRSIAVHESKLALASLVAFVAVYGASTYSAQSTTCSRAWAAGLVLTALGLSAYGWFVIHGGKPPLRATFTNPDCFSVLPISACYLAVGLALQANRRVGLVFLCVAILLFVAMLLTASRAGLVGWTAGLLTFIVSMVMLTAPKTTKIGYIPYLTVSLCFVLLILVSASSFPVMQRLQLLISGRDPDATQSRFNVAVYGLKTAARNPIVGAGPGCFALAYQQDRPEGGQDMYMNVAHNDYMQWLVETGLPGLALWLAVLFLAFHKPKTTSPAEFTSGVRAGVAATLVYSFLNVGLPVPAVFLWVGALLGLLTGATSGRSSSGRGWAALLGLLLLPCGAWAARMGWQLQRQQDGVARANGMLKQLDWENGYRELETAVAILPHHAQLRLKLAAVAQRAYMFSKEKMWLAREEEQLLLAAKASPNNVAVLRQLAIFYHFRSRKDDAAVVLERARKLAPYSTELKRLYAWNCVLRGKFREALQQLPAETASYWDPIAKLIVMIEMQTPGSAERLIQELKSQKHPQLTKILGLAVDSALQNQQPEIALKLSETARRQDPKNLGLQYHHAVLLGQLGRRVEQLDLLQKLCKDSLLLDTLEPEHTQMWQTWVKLRIADKSYKGLTRMLEDYLAKDLNQNWARFVISEIYEAQGRRSDARAALRDGLSYDVDGSLRIALGDLYHKHGIDDVARNYYLEALPIVSDKQSVQSRISELKSPSEQDEDAL